MCQCWERNPSDRPTFTSLVNTLSNSLGSKAGYLDIGAFTDRDTFKRVTTKISGIDLKQICGEEVVSSEKQEEVNISSWSASFRQSNKNIYVSSENLHH